MNRLKTLLGLILFISFFAYSQSYIKNNIHPYSHSLLGTVTGGITMGKTDYKDVKLGISGLLSASYFFRTSNENIFGARFTGAFYNVKGKDSQKSQEVFSTDAVNLNASLLYSYAFSQNFLPYIGAGFSYYFFNPKDENGQLLPYNSNGSYSKSTPGFDAEIGISVPVSAQISIDANSAMHFLFTDYFDDIAAGTSKDFFASASLGVSYAFISNRDSDGDGIIDADDHCPDQPEDFDGFEDSDGCPDYDNDGDGIPDIKDQCPNEAEDFDGFQDEDGCPDLDNDGDGILDKDDKCPNEAEDFDGFQDEDGCPDLDNDNDGIPDKDDKCPNQPETINGYQDNDGCPDVVPQSNTGEANEKGALKSENTFIIPADNLFFTNRAEIKPVAYKELDKIVAQLKKDPNDFWRIEGHMDSQGTEQWIRTMSSKRAEAVYHYFISHGLDASKFTIYGLGDKFPIGNNKTEEGREQNRRIVIAKERQ